MPELIYFITSSDHHINWLDDVVIKINYLYSSIACSSKTQATLLSYSK